MPSIATVCVAWTTWLIVLTLKPNETANYLMGTGDLDDGQFWLIVDPDPEIKYLGVVGLSLVDAAYIFVLFKMFVRPAKSGASGGFSSSILVIPESDTTSSQPAQQQHSWWTIIVNSYNRASGFWTDLTSLTGRNRKIWNMMLKALDLGVQSAQLVEVLENGFPAVLVRTYAIFLCCNALSCAVAILSPRHSALAEVLIDFIFDLFAAVMYPIVVLAYCYSEFDFDREVFQLYVDHLPLGSFERLARMSADPSEIALFLTSLDSLRILTAPNLLLRISMNLSFCNRFRGVVDALLRQRRRAFRLKHSAVAANSHFQESYATPSPMNTQRRVPRVFAAVFVAFGVATIVYSEKAMTASWSLCADYPQCVVYKHRWHDGETCPCLTLIDVDAYPRAYADWMSPVDVTDSVRTLSASGDLRELQLINHGLPRWPEELRRCRNLQYVSILYTGLEKLPTWAKEFKNLQYFHFEGKEMFPNLQHIDENLFSNMPHLIYLHMGVSDDLRAFPPLNGVPRLRSLVLAHMFSITQMPSFDNLRELQRLELAYLPALATVPDLTHLTQLAHFATSRAAHFCCNGFLGSCDLSDPFCAANPVIGVLQAQCIADSLRATSGMEAVLATFPSNICQRDNEFDQPLVSDFLTREIIEVCNGTLFQRCEYPKGSGQEGICYNNRLQVVSCVVNANYIALRRAQIAAKIGLPCDPSIEKWLGCIA